MEMERKMRVLEMQNRLSRQQASDNKQVMAHMLKSFQDASDAQIKQTAQLVQHLPIQIAQHMNQVSPIRMEPAPIQTQYSHFEKPLNQINSMSPRTLELSNTHTNSPGNSPEKSPNLKKTHGIGFVPKTITPLEYLIEHSGGSDPVSPRLKVVFLKLIQFLLGFIVVSP